MADLQDRTRWEPAEAEPRIARRWLDAGLHHPDPEGDAGENFSIAIPPRTSRARCTWATR
jgi:valyl-tRNA synthetase